MNLKDVINMRGSARSFLPDPVSEKVLRNLLEAARLAPSAGNGQSWSFILFK